MVQMNTFGVNESKLAKQEERSSKIYKIEKTGVKYIIMIASAKASQDRYVRFATVSI